MANTSTKLLPRESKDNVAQKTEISFDFHTSLKLFSFFVRLFNRAFKSEASFKVKDELLKMLV